MTLLTVSFSITPKDCEDILVTAVEAGVHGSTPWLNDLDAAWQTRDGKRGVKLAHTPVKGSEYTERPKYTYIGAKRIAAALGEMLSDGDSGTRWNACNALGEELDGPRADCVMQVAVFGKIVYG